MRSLEKLDRWIAGKVRDWTSLVAGEPPRRELLEIRRDILEDVRHRIQPKGEGKYVFPYNGVAIRIAAENGEERELRQGAFAAGDGLDSEIRELLHEAGVKLSSDFTVDISVVEDAVLAATPRPFTIEYTARQPETTPKKTVRPDIKLTVIRGVAEPAELSTRAERINMGRLKEVFGERDGLRRRNDIAFADTETTISREHAYIRYIADEGRFRLYDSGSQRGSSIYRDGRRIEVPRGPTRGVQLQSGDEIHLGEALLRFEVVSSPES